LIGTTLTFGRSSVRIVAVADPTPIAAFTDGDESKTEKVSLASIVVSCLIGTEKIASVAPLGMVIV
jgi:hypothetical protein